jgi:predicted nucleic acid-binding protein
VSEGGAVAVYFFDSSAIVKRYAAEPGSSWVDSICDEAAGNIVALSLGRVLT